MPILTTITPLSDELADANWIEYIVTRIDAQDEDLKSLRSKVEAIIYQTPFTHFENFYEDSVSQYAKNVNTNLSAQGLEVVSVDVATGLAWCQTKFQESLDEEDEDSEDEDWDEDSE